MRTDMLKIAVIALGVAGMAGCAQTGGYGETAGSTYGGTTTRSDYGSGYGEYCADCGTVEEITVVEETSGGIGVGAVLGTIAGGIAGSQVGSGTGKTAATVAGAAGGGYAGHQLQQRYGNQVDFRITVRTDDGPVRTVVMDDDPGVRIGQRVRIVDGRVVPL